MTYGKQVLKKPKSCDYLMTVFTRVWLHGLPLYGCAAMAVIRILLLVCMFQGTWAMVYVNSNMKSFSYAIKHGFIHANEEKTLYEHDSGQPGVITEQWFTGRLTMNQDTRIRIYIDGEKEASLDFNLFLAHGLGFRESDDLGNIPWGTRRIAHAADGGIYNTIRIPFSKSFRVTATAPNSDYFWYFIRGVENYPVVLGDLILPPHTRLRLYKNENVYMKPLEFLRLAQVNNSAGALFMVTLVANSSNLGFLEGCMRSYVDEGNRTTWLSSGTEDFFLSAYYFDKGLYHLDNAGLTYLDRNGSGLVSAYKFFENDPLLFTKSFELWWRCSDLDFSKDKRHGCPNTWPDPTPPRSEQFYTKYSSMNENMQSKEEPSLKGKPPKFAGKEGFFTNDRITLKEKIAMSGESFLFDSGILQPAVVTTYTWVYEW